MQGMSLFSFAGIPVFANPWFLLLIGYGFRDLNVLSGLAWTIAVTSGLLVHEFGHALTARAFSLHPVVILHGFGGLTAHAEASRDRDDALIVAAGPFAGLLFGVLSVVAWLVWTAVGPTDAGPISEFAEYLFSDLMFVNIGWSFLNLLPIWPLDGGLLYRTGLMQVARPLLAERITHITALVLLGGALFLASGNTWIVILSAYFMWQNFQALRGEVRSGPVRSKNPEAKAMLARLQEAYDAGDFREAARLGQLLRQETTVSAPILKQTWALLGAATARLGQHQEALHYLQRAPLTRDVIEARIECYYALGLDNDLEAILASPEFARWVPDDRQQEILRVVGEVVGEALKPPEKIETESS